LDQDEGEFEELVAAWWGSVARGFFGQGRVAVGTGFGEDGDDLVTLLDRLKKAGLARVTGLSTGLATGRSRLGQARGSGGRIGGRRARGVRGVLVEARFELGQAGLELTHQGTQRGDLGFEFGHAGLEGSAARASGIGRAHTPGIRGAGPGFLPT
jgi:hypothetical protein